MGKEQGDFDSESEQNSKSEEEFFYAKMRGILANKLGIEKTEEIIGEWSGHYLHERLAIWALCIDFYPKEFKSLIDEYGLKNAGEPNFTLSPEQAKKEKAFCHHLTRILTDALGKKRAQAKINNLTPNYRDEAMAILAACLEECPSQLKSNYIDRRGLKINVG